MSEENQQQNEKGTGNQRLPVKGLAIWLLLLALFLTLFQVISQRQDSVQRLEFKPDFIKLVEQGKVRSAEVVSEVLATSSVEVAEISSADANTIVTPSWILLN